MKVAKLMEQADMHPNEHHSHRAPKQNDALGHHPLGRGCSLGRICCWHSKGVAVYVGQALPGSDSNSFRLSSTELAHPMKYQHARSLNLDKVQKAGLEKEVMGRELWTKVSG